MSPLEAPPPFPLLLMLLWGYKKLTPFIPWLVVIYVLPLSWCRKKPLFIMSIFYSPTHPLEHRKLIYPLTFLTFSDLFFYLLNARRCCENSGDTYIQTARKSGRISYVIYNSQMLCPEINPDSEQIKKGENWRKSSYKTHSSKCSS